MDTCGGARLASLWLPTVPCWSPTTARNPSGASVTWENSGHTSIRWRVSLRANAESSVFPLVSQLLIDDIEQRFTFLESFELRDEKLHRVVQPIRGMVGAMRRKQDVFQFVE